MYNGILNIGSLILGLVAWVVPIALMIRKDKKTQLHSLGVFISVTACATSLLLQLFYTWTVIQKGDWTALLDIYGGTIFASIVLLIVTVALNIPLLLRVKHKA